MEHKISNFRSFRWRLFFVILEPHLDIFSNHCTISPGFIFSMSCKASFTNFSFIASMDTSFSALNAAPFFLIACSFQYFISFSYHPAEISTAKPIWSFFSDILLHIQYCSAPYPCQSTIPLLLHTEELTNCGSNLLSDISTLSHLLTIVVLIHFFICSFFTQNFIDSLKMFSNVVVWFTLTLLSIHLLLFLREAMRIKLKLHHIFGFRWIRFVFVKLFTHSSFTNALRIAHKSLSICLSLVSSHGYPCAYFRLVAFFLPILLYISLY